MFLIFLKKIGGRQIIFLIFNNIKYKLIKIFDNFIQIIAFIFMNIVLYHFFII